MNGGDDETRTRDLCRDGNSIDNPASTANASGFLLTAFSNATPQAFLQLQALIPASRPKKH